MILINQSDNTSVRTIFDIDVNSRSRCTVLVMVCINVSVVMY